MAPDEIKERVTKYYNTVRDMDADAWAANFAEDGTLEDPVGSTVISGRQALSQFFSNSVGKMFKKFNMKEQTVFTVPGGAAVKWDCNATAPNGNIITFEGITIIEYNESGLITSLKAYWEQAALIEKIQQ